MNRCCFFAWPLFRNSCPWIKDLRTSLEVSHNLLLSHGKAVKLFREMNIDAQIGIALNLSYHYPASEKAEDIEAAELSFSLAGRWYLDPVLKGRYPENALKLYKKKVLSFLSLKMT